MKTYPRTIRRDASLDHIHSLPDGKKTDGMIAKPTASNMMSPHTHLYQHEGKTHETGLASDSDPGHTHESIIGETSGRLNMPAQESFGPRNDSALRIGREWVVRNDSGVVVARGATAKEAEDRAKKLFGA